MKSSCRMSEQEHHSCYCNGANEGNDNMLQCGKCRCWYHETCVQCLDQPMLMGDRFFVFICSNCNSGSEYLARLELKWVDIAHLVLYNLAKTNRKKYFDIQNTILTYLEENWSRLQLLGKVANCSTAVRKSNLLYVLVNNQNRFKCAKEIRKKSSLWTLRHISPPDAPFAVPKLQDKEDCESWQFKVPGREFKVLCLSKKFEKRRVKRVRSTTINHPPINYKPIRNGFASKGVPVEEKKVKQNAEVPKTRRVKCAFKDLDYQTKNLLDILIPTPQNFKRSSNPFAKIGMKSKQARLELMRRYPLLSTGPSTYRIGRSTIECQGSLVIKCRKFVRRKASEIQNEVNLSQSVTCNGDHEQNGVDNSNSSVVLAKRTCKGGLVEYLLETEEIITLD